MNPLVKWSDQKAYRYICWLITCYCKARKCCKELKRWSLISKLLHKASWFIVMFYLLLIFHNAKNVILLFFFLLLFQWISQRCSSVELCAPFWPCCPHHALHPTPAISGQATCSCQRLCLSCRFLCCVSFSRRKRINPCGITKITAGWHSVPNTVHIGSVITVPSSE